MPAALPFFGLTADGSVEPLEYDDATILTIFIQVLDHGGKVLLRLLVEIRNSDTSSEDGVIGMFGGEVRSGLSGEVLRPRELRVVA